MDGLTLGELNADLVLLVSTIGAIALLGAKIREWLNKDVAERLNSVDMQQTKNFLVRTLADIDRGVNLTEVEKQRLKEQYDHYTKGGGNSYIKDKYEKLKRDNKL